MGHTSSKVRSSEFSRPGDAASPHSKENEQPENTLETGANNNKPVINISNKMVERLVEDNIVNENLETKRVLQDYQDKIYIQKLKCIDETHSERHGLTLQNMDDIIKRIEKKTSYYGSPEPICQDCHDEIIVCYDKNKSDLSPCNKLVSKFEKCVAEQTANRLKRIIVTMEEESTRKSKEIEKAKKLGLFNGIEQQYVTP